jgi:hypothetical protein
LSDGDSHNINSVELFLELVGEIISEDIGTPFQALQLSKSYIT